MISSLRNVVVLVGLGVLTTQLMSCTNSTTLTPEATVYTLCKSFQDTEFALRPFAGQMTESQRNSVGNAVIQASALCTTPIADMSDPVAISNKLREYLRTLVIAQQELKK